MYLTVDESKMTSTVSRCVFCILTIVLVASGSVQLRRQKRAAFEKYAHLWPDGVIPYVIDASYFSKLYFHHFLCSHSAKFELCLSFKYFCMAQLESIRKISSTTNKAITLRFPHIPLPLAFSDNLKTLSSFALLFLIYVNLLVGKRAIVFHLNALCKLLTLSIT